MSEELKVLLELSVLAVSGVGTVVIALVKRSVSDQDHKLDALGSKLDEIDEKVGRHAERLAEGKAQMDAFRRELDEVKAKLDDFSRNGWARSGRGG